MNVRSWPRCANCGMATYVCAKRGCKPRQKAAPRGLVIWKEEDDGVGPATHYVADARPSAAPSSTDPIGRPYGSPPPAGVTEYGWTTKSKARALARSLGADFEES
jgi:hypothetical protein